MSKKEIVRIVVAITTWVLSAGLDITAGILGIKAEDAQSHVNIHFIYIYIELFCIYIYICVCAGEACEDYIFRV